MTEPAKDQGQSQPLPNVSSDIGRGNYDAESETRKKPTLFQSVPSSTHQQAPAENTSTSCEQSDAVIVSPTLAQRLLFKMYLVLKEITVMLFLAFTYAALTNEPSKVSKSPTAFPFFPRNSVVTDWYNGEVSKAIEKSRMSDIAFIMYYAPWDAESQEVRHEFDMAARYLQKQIKFAAVNCWQPGSECRKQYAKTYNWPILIVYPSHGKGVQYRGPRLARYMSKFLMGFSRPLIRLESDDDVYTLLGSHDAVVLGCVNALAGNSEYGPLYIAALRFLEKDPLQDLAFAVITGRKCREEDYSPKLSLHMWNETLIYPSDSEWKSDALLTWIIKSLHQVSLWITPVMTKSLSLSSYIQSGPALILFTPRNPFAPSIDYYDLLREAALDYHNCGDNQHINFNSFLLHTKRLENYVKYVSSKKEKSCNYVLQDADKHSKKCSPTITISSDWSNGSRCLEPPHSTAKNLKCFPPTLQQCTCSDQDNQSKNFCPKHSTSKLIHRLIEEETVPSFRHFDTSMLSDLLDPRSARNLQKNWRREKCRFGLLSEKIHPTVWVRQMSEENFTMDNHRLPNIKGLVCQTNVTLTFAAIDSLRYYQFAERLGIDLSDSKDQTAAVIIDEKMETHHVLKGDINEATVREFVLNFTIGILARSFASLSSIKHPETHEYSVKSDGHTSDKLHLLELNSETFLKTILQKDKAVVVFYYSKQCSFCNGISYAFLTVAKMFSSLPSLQFTRIDGDLNILPWEYTMDSYPTVILFPARSKSDSRVFPKSVPISVPNLISFLLANLDSNLKLHTMWFICNQTKFKSDRDFCISSVRTENLSLIDQTLRIWRRNSDGITRTKLLRRLQHLRHINLLLAHSPHNSAGIQRHMRKLHDGSLFKEPLSSPLTDNRNSAAAIKSKPRDEL